MRPVEGGQAWRRKRGGGATRTSKRVLWRGCEGPQSAGLCLQHRNHRERRQTDRDRETGRHGRYLRADHDDAGAARRMHGHWGGQASLVQRSKAGSSWVRRGGGGGGGGGVRGRTGKSLRL